MKMKFKKPIASQKIKKSMFYSTQDFGIIGKCQGYKSKICIIGCGAGGHDDTIDPSDMEVLLDGCNDPNDNIGLSVMHAGVIGGINKKTICGIAPKAEIYYAKCIDDNKITGLKEISAALLWAIVNKANVVILDAFPDDKSNYFDSILEKAKQQNITVLVRLRDINEQWEDDENILIVEPIEGKFAVLPSDKPNKCRIAIPNKDFYTTFLMGKYAKIEKEDLSISLLAGLFSVGYQKFGEKGKAATTSQILKKLQS